MHCEYEKDALCATKDVLWVGQSTTKDALMCHAWIYYTPWDTRGTPCSITARHLYPILPIYNPYELRT